MATTNTSSLGTGGDAASPTPDRIFNTAEDIFLVRGHVAAVEILPPTHPTATAALALYARRPPGLLPLATLATLRLLLPAETADLTVSSLPAVATLLADVTRLTVASTRSRLLAPRT